MFLINTFKENENPEQKMKKMEQKFASLQIVKIIEKLGNEKVIASICEIVKS